MQNIIGIKPALKTAVEPEVDRPPETPSVVRKQGRQGLLVPTLEAIEQLVEPASGIPKRRNLCISVGKATNGV